MKVGLNRDLKTDDTTSNVNALIKLATRIQDRVIKDRESGYKLSTITVESLKYDIEWLIFLLFISFIIFLIRKPSKHQSDWGNDPLGDAIFDAYLTTEILDDIYDDGY